MVEKENVSANSIFTITSLFFFAFQSHFISQILHEVFKIRVKTQLALTLSLVVL